MRRDNQPALYVWNRKSRVQASDGNVEKIMTNTLNFHYAGNYGTSKNFTSFSEI